MSVPSILARFYPVLLAFGNISVGVGLYVTDALFFAVLLWISAALVLIGALSSVAPALFPYTNDTGGMSRRHPR